MIRFDEVFQRHPGHYDVVHDTERPGKKDGSIERVQVAVHHGLSAAEVVVLIRNGIAKDPSATFYIHAATRGDTGHLGWIDSSNINYLFGEVEGDGRVELSDERPAPTLVRGRKKPVPEVDDPVLPGLPAEPVSEGGPVRDVSPEKTPRSRKPRREQPTKLPGDRFPVVRGRALTIGISAAEGWPKSKPAQTVREFFLLAGNDIRRATAAEVVQALGPQLKEMGVEFPASLVSRLKQSGCLKEVV